MPPKKEVKGADAEGEPDEEEKELVEMELVNNFLKSRLGRCAKSAEPAEETCINFNLLTLSSYAHSSGQEPSINTLCTHQRPPPKLQNTQILSKFKH